MYVYAYESILYARTVLVRMHTKMHSYYLVLATVVWGVIVRWQRRWDPGGRLTNKTVVVRARNYYYYYKYIYHATK